jgi:hypothetical protein
MSTFNPVDFLNFSTTETLDTKRTPCPVGDRNAVITKVEPRPWTSKTDPTQSGMALDVTYEVLDQEPKTVTHLDKVLVRQGIMLDLTPTNGIDYGKGKNVTLGRLREATGQNVPGAPWAPSMLIGQAVKVKVSHRVVGEDIYDQVSGTAKA